MSSSSLPGVLMALLSVVVACWCCCWTDSHVFDFSQKVNYACEELLCVGIRFDIYFDLGRCCVGRRLGLCAVVRAHVEQMLMLDVVHLMSCITDFAFFYICIDLEYMSHSRRRCRRVSLASDTNVNAQGCAWQCRPRCGDGVSC